MNVFVAGGTGDIGRPVVRRLTARGHRVVATTRAPARVPLLEELGAIPVVVDALDREAVRRAVSEARPEAVVDLLTALPRNGPTRESHLRATNRIRAVAAPILAAAATEAGARVFAGESIVFVYGYGDRGPTPVTEEQPVADPEAEHPSVRDALRALGIKERSIRQAGPAGVVLRYGLFYGPEAGGIAFMLTMLRRRLLGMPGGGSGVASWIHLEDAAEATVAALERGQAGTFNVVDDEPVSFRTFIEELARRAGTPRPYPVPAWLARPLFPYPALFMSGMRLPVSNEAARRHLDWRPAFPTYREGLADVVGATGVRR